MPPPNPQSKAAKPQALSPADAKRLANRTAFPFKIPQSSTPDPNASTKAPAPGPSLAPKGPIRSLFSHLRNRYASLPRPVKHTFRVLRVLAPLVPISLFFSEHVMQLMWVRGPSMTPYLNEDYDQMQTKSDMVLVNMSSLSRFWPWNRTIRLERGMVVTFRSPAHSSHIAIKRIIGLPGDRITTREPCLKASQIVPFNHVWLEGDAEDPRRSLDSNTYGPVSISLITGRVNRVLGPRNRALDWKDWETNDDYRQEVRDRVLKEAVSLARPEFE